MLAGIEGLVNDVISGWVGPIFILAVAGFSVFFIKDRKFRELFSFLAIAAIVGVCVYLGAEFFGKSGKLTNAAKTVGEKVNTAFYITEKT